MGVRGAESPDDEPLVAACLGGDGEALGALLLRHGLLAELVLLREGHGEADAPGRQIAGPLGEAPEALRGFVPGASSLRAWLAMWVRRRLRTGTPRTPGLSASLPRPEPVRRHAAAVDLGPLVLAASDVLTRQPATGTAALRCRLAGLGASETAAALGLTEAQVLAALARTAERLAAALEAVGSAGHDPGLVLRGGLGVASPAERLALCRRTDRAPATRAPIEALLDALRTDARTAAPPPAPDCPPLPDLAGYTEGAVRGRERARIEMHLTTCPTCLDEVAALVGDLKALAIARDAQPFARSVQVAAMGLAAGAFAPSTARADAATAGPGAAAATDLARLGRACQALVLTGEIERGASGLVPRDLPSDDEAPLAAFEALVLDDPGAAFRALHAARTRSPVASRLRLFAAAAGGAPEVGRRWAEAIRNGYEVDAAAAVDAEAVLALAPDELLPRELLAERLASLVPDLVRELLAAHRRTPR